ncbi:MAG: iron-sulfur cluster repair di-iron protein [Candidatus Korobacteraceae bacterium]
MSIEATQTVGDLAVKVPGATQEFEKLGIDYCCGGSRTLGEACVAANVSVEQAMSRLQEGLAAAQPKPGCNWKSEPLADLIAHISGTHHVYVREECPRIEKLGAKVVSAHGSNHPELLQVQALFAGLAAELSVHLMKEEQILFPYVIRLEEAAIAREPAPPAMFGTVVNPVRMMMQEHDGAGDTLKKLRTITHDYTLPADACVSYTMLYEAVQAFEADLHQHIHLENNILFPRAVALESGK